jgi:hypothetical protein
MGAAWVEKTKSKTSATALALEKRVKISYAQNNPYTHSIESIPLNKNLLIVQIFLI